MMADVRVPKDFVAAARDAPSAAKIRFDRAGGHGQGKKFNADAAAGGRKRDPFRRHWFCVVRMPSGEEEANCDADKTERHVRTR